MGIGSLRRYHPTLDEKLAQDAGVEAGDRFNEEGNKSLDGVTATAPVGKHASDVQGDPGSIVEPPAEGEAAQLAGGDLTDEQKAQLDGDAGRSTDGLTAEQKATLDATVQPEQPPRHGTGSGVEAWREYALAHGRTEKDLEGMSRDDIADLFTK